MTIVDRIWERIVFYHEAIGVFPTAIYLGETEIKELKEFICGNSLMESVYDDESLFGLKLHITTDNSHIGCS